MWSIQWKDNERHEVENLDHLNRLLDELSASGDCHSPILVQLKTPTGELLMIGLAGEQAVLDHIAAGGWPAQHSVGDVAAQGTIPFMMGSYDSEMPRAYAIPASAAREAVEHFFKNGKLSNSVVWEND
jgi:hypothetical protein